LSLLVTVINLPPQIPLRKSLRARTPVQCPLSRTKTNIDIGMTLRLFSSVAVVKRLLHASMLSLSLLYSTFKSQDTPFPDQNQCNNHTFHCSTKHHVHTKTSQLQRQASHNIAQTGHVEFTKKPSFHSIPPRNLQHDTHTKQKSLPRRPCRRVNQHQQDRRGCCFTTRAWGW
jgi:hypothetical protein